MNSSHPHSKLLACLVVAACAGCSARHEPLPPPKEAPAFAGVTTRHLDSEALGDPAAADAASDPFGGAEVVAPPDPARLLDSIGPGTSPERATSVRLTDEGRRLLQDGDDAAAIDRIERALKIDPTNAHGYYWLAQVHARRGRLDQALAFADKAAILFSAGDQAWLVQTYTFRASILEGAGRFPEARASYRRAVDLQPGSVAARAGLARLGDPAQPPQNR